MEAGVIFGWLFVALISGLFGIGRKIGYGMTFLISLLFTPIVGVIAAYCTKSCNEYEMEKEKIKLLKEMRDKIVGIEKKVFVESDGTGEIKSLYGKIVKYNMKSELVGNKERVKVTFDDGKEGNLYPVEGTLEFSFIAAGKFIHYKDKESALIALHYYINEFEVTSQGRTSKI